MLLRGINYRSVQQRRSCAPLIILVRRARDCFYVDEIARLIRAAKKWVTADARLRGAGRRRRRRRRRRRESERAIITITRAYPTRYVNYGEERLRRRGIASSDARFSVSSTDC